MPFNFRRMPESPGSYYTTQHGGLDHEPMHLSHQDPMDEDDDSPLMNLDEQDIRSEDGMYDSDDGRYSQSRRMMDREYDDAGLTV